MIKEKISGYSFYYSILEGNELFFDEDHSLTVFFVDKNRWDEEFSNELTSAQQVWLSKRLGADNCVCPGKYVIDMSYDTLVEYLEGIGCLENE